MDSRLQIIEHLYGDAERRPPLPDGLDADAALRGELRAMSEVKFGLDHRRRARPDAAVLDRIVAHAAAAGPATVEVGTPSPDRGPRAHRRYRRMLLGLVVSVFAAASVGLGLFVHTGEAPPTAAAQAPPPAAVPASSAPLLLPPPDGAAQGISTLEAYARAQQDAVLDWDDGADVRTLQRRIELLEARSTAAVPRR